MTKQKQLQAPFIYFGGKSQVAPVIWDHFGDPDLYVEPFFGSGAALLARPTSQWVGSMGHEIVNDADGFLSNLWRAIQHDPEKVAHYADWPVNEADLLARHGWLVGLRGRLTERLVGDKDYYSAKIAGYWVWGISAWIGGGWCQGKGPWVQQDGKLLDSRKIPRLTSGRGINRQIPRLTSGRGINRQIPRLTSGQGINRQIPRLTSGRGIREQYSQHLAGLMLDLQERLRMVLVACGDWSRLCRRVEAAAEKGRTVACLLDPPYGGDGEEWTHDGYAAACDPRAVWDWAVKTGAFPTAKIAVCGYAGQYETPDGWTEHRWKAQGGYGSQGEGAGRVNAARETIWFSPACRPKKTKAWYTP